MYGLSRHGWFYVKKDSTGLLWEEDWPVFKVNFWDAQAYAAYFSELSQKKWYIPNEMARKRIFNCLFFQEICSEESN